MIARFFLVLLLADKIHSGKILRSSILTIKRLWQSNLSLILGQYSATLHRGLDGKFGFALRNGKIIEIDPGNPTVRTKMKVGDRLIAINETSYTNDKDAIRQLIGSKNENMVRLTLARPSSGKLIFFVYLSSSLVILACAVKV